MIIAVLTTRGTCRVLNGTVGMPMPVHHAHRRADGRWVIGVADFRYPSDRIPFQCWMLAPDDYVLQRVKYDGLGYTRENVKPDEVLGPLSW